MSYGYGGFGGMGHGVGGFGGGMGHGVGGFGHGGYGGFCHGGYGGQRGGGFALIVVLFILLIIVGAAYTPVKK